MKLKDIPSLKELEKVLLEELRRKGFDGEDFSIFEAFSKDENAYIANLTKEFNKTDKFIDNIDKNVLEWYRVEHEVTEDSLPYWVFMDYIANKSAVDPQIDLIDYTKHALKRKYEYSIDTQI